MSKLAALLVVALAVSQVSAQAQGPTVRVCVYGGDSAQAADCSAWLQEAVPATTVQMQCVFQTTAEDCLRLINTGGAELMRGGGNEIFTAGSQYDLQAFISEVYDNANTQYFSVAVVKKTFCDARNNAVTLADLQGVKACTTGYRKTAGWTLPVGFMVSQNIMPVVSSRADVQDDAESFASYFSDVCAPGTTNGGLNAAGPLNDGTTTGKSYPELCAACLAGGATCAGDSTNKYNSYAGALRCMIEGAGDVAFTKHVQPIDSATGGAEADPTWSVPQADMRLVCADGTGCKTVDQWASCYLAAAPAHAFVGRPTFGGSQAAASALVAKSADPTWVLRGVGLRVLSADARSLKAASTTAPSVTVQQLMGAQSYNSFQSIRSLEAAAPAPSGGAQTVRVCVADGGDAAQCTSWLQRSVPAGSQLKMQCVMEPTFDRCMERISSGGAELMRGGGDQIFTAGKRYGMVAYVSEDYGDAAGSAYYGVAVVKKSFCDARNNDVTLRDLQGVKACTTGYRRTAGWTLPVGYMVSRAIMPVVSSRSDVQDDAETFTAFFSDVCAPGTTDGDQFGAGPLYDGSRVGKQWPDLCTACTAGGADCTSASKYASYEGALRCMIEGSGDVALLKHTTPLDSATGGSEAQPWSVPKSEMRLVCADNSGCRSVDDWQTCSYARAPAHAFVGRSNFGGSAEVARNLQAASANADWVNEGIVHRVLTEDAVALRAVRVSGRPVTVVDLMGADAYNSFESMRALTEPTPTASSSDDGKLNSGEIAGVVIGSVVGGALIMGIIAVFIIRHNKKKAWEQFAQNHQESLTAKMGP